MINLYRIVVVSMALCNCCFATDEAVVPIDLETITFSEAPEIIAEAETAMQDFASARQDLPAEIACLARNETWFFGDARGMQLVEHTHVSVRDESSSAVGSGTSFFYFGTAVNIRQAEGGKFDFAQNIGIPSWEQFLRVGETTYYRRGGGNKYDTIVEAKADSQDGLPRGHRPDANVDFFIAPLCWSAQIFRVDVKKNTLAYFLTGDVLRAARKGTKLIAVWEFRNPVGKLGGFAIVTFDDKSGGMPVKVDWPEQQPGDSLDDVVKRGKIVGTVQTKWQQSDIDGMKRYLPSKILARNLSDQTRSSSQEGVWLIEWRFGKEVLAAIPESPEKSHYWQLEPLGLFNHNPKLSHKDYAEQFENRYK